MRYIETFREGMHVSDVYLCKISRSSLQKWKRIWQPGPSGQDRNH